MAELQAQTNSIGKRRSRAVGLEQFPTPNGSGVTVEDQADAVVVTTRVQLTGLEITMTDEAGVVAYGGHKILDFPQGRLMVLGASADLTVTESGGINADFDGDFSLGSATASNNATLSSTEADVIPSQETPTASSSATTAKGGSTGVTVLDGSSTAADLFLNFLVDDADQDGGGTLTVSGDIYVTWVLLGTE